MANNEFKHNEIILGVYNNGRHGRTFFKFTPLMSMACNYIMMLHGYKSFDKMYNNAYDHDVIIDHTATMSHFCISPTSEDHYRIALDGTIDKWDEDNEAYVFYGTITPKTA